jgi:hypothetical protein
MLLEVWVRKLIARFKLAVVIALFLYSIIGQMNEPICHVLQVEIFTTCAKITFIIPVTLQVTVNCGHKSVSTDVKLAVLIQKRFFNVLLDNVRSLLAIEICIRYNFFDLRKFSAHLDATASICVFARLNYPNLLAQFLKCTL